MLNDLSSPAALLATRRSGKLRDMGAPGPDAAQLGRILAAAMRTPDHGKLAPWRLVRIAPERRDAFAALLERASQETHGAVDRRSIDDYAHRAPEVVVLLSTPLAESKIPLWEQELSAGAAAMNLLTAAHAEGFVASWLTGWPAYAPAVIASMAPDGGRIAGFFFIGTALAPPSERPRPDPAAIVSEWRPEGAV